MAVVEDEEGVRRGLERLLRTSGMVVRAFASGESFLASLGQETPDCALLDLHMPGTDGFEVLRHIELLGAPFPVLVITGHDNPETRERVAMCGVAAYLRKPLDGDELLEAIHTSIGRD